MCDEHKRRTVQLPESVMVALRSAVAEYGPETSAGVVVRDMLDILADHLGIEFIDGE
jgi:hypothetical protein